MYWNLRFILVVIWTLAISWLSATPGVAQSQTLIIPAPDSLDSNGRPSNYFEALLRLAFSKTVEEGKIEFNYFPHRPEKERLRKILTQRQGLDVIWSSSTPRREQEMLAIKVNLLKGINEYRLLLIRAEDQPQFESVNTLVQLRQFTLGTGMHWSDTGIFKQNQFNCFVTGDYENMFSGLRRKRFDFMARGIHEIKSELETYTDLKLVTENHLLLHYPQPIYFFVHKSNKKLARRIKKGLELAQADGSFDQLFLEFPSFRQALEDLNQAKAERVLLELTNQ